MQSSAMKGTEPVRNQTTKIRTIADAIEVAAVVIVLCLSGVLANAQNDAATSTNASSPGEIPLPTINKDVQEVNLLFTVTDHRGHFVHDLKQSDFIVEDNGELPARITHFENQAQLPLRLALVLDNSGSVTYILGDEKKAASTFLKQILRPGFDLALVVAFNEKPRVVQAWTSDSHVLSSAIGKIHSSEGETAIFDAVAFASSELAKANDNQVTRRAIILITDGGDNRSHWTLEGAARTALQNESAVYVLSANLNWTGKPDTADIAMSRLAESTGGTFVHAFDEDAMTSAFSKTAKGLRSQYMISYVPNEITPDGSFHRLLILGPKKLLVHHRMGYLAR
jgi:VWFA-related protein